jgi:peroxiredoxin family protein
MEDSLNLMLLSGDYAKTHAAAMVALVASSLGQSVNVFVSMEALPAFHKDVGEREAIGKGPIGQIIAESASPDYVGLFNEAKGMGDVNVYACSLVTDLKHWELADLVPIFDDMMGVTGFLGKASGGTSLTF